ncbi:MAG TPA: hypothetical protein ENK11_00480, partial [Phycisphaerales bacterium]|nr:hypothetical protein [Phycisphaerales bacterium]
MLPILAAVVAVGLAIFILLVLGKVFFRLVGHVFGVLGAMFSDFFRAIGALIVSVIYVPLILLNIVIGRWSAAAHFGRVLTSECRTAGACAYRVLIGHPLRLFGLGGMTEGLEQRLPQAVAAAPGRDKPSKSHGMFEGYTIIGSLPGGGSGGKLYIAEPDELKRAAFNRQGHRGVDRVVIKTFSLKDGSSLPQIVRESRALDAAKKMGLVLEHELGEERFFYVMRYVPGDSLTIVTQRLHADGDGLSDEGLRLVMGYASDLLESLDVYHRGGLWHKDVKPDNLIVDRTPDPALGRGRAHLVDFGLITPLRSAMTLTTHGTEYFRDPELVRQALRGVKVHQIDGARFDIYAAGAVLYSMIENSFPAHGGLSRVSKRCPEALRWIIRRAMTDYDKRYTTAHEMLDDLLAVVNAPDPFAVKPADLPSMRGDSAHDEPMEPVEPVSVDVPRDDEPVAVVAAASPVPPREPAHAEPVSPASHAERASRPRIRVTHWWSGRYEVEQPRAAKRRARTPAAPFPAVARPPRAVVPPESRASAAEQLANARRRIEQRRTNARKRRGHLPAHGPTRIAGRRRSYEPAGINAGVVAAAVIALGISVAIVFSLAVVPFFSPARMTVGASSSGDSIMATAGIERAASPTPPAAPAPPATPGKVKTDIPVPAPDKPLDGFALVFISDFRPPLDETYQTEMESADVLLSSRGVRIASNVNDAETPDASDTESLIAPLLALRGQRLLDGTLGGILSQYIGEHDDIDAV